MVEAVFLVIIITFLAYVLGEIVIEILGSIALILVVFFLIFLAHDKPYFDTCMSTGNSFFHCFNERILKP